MPKSQRHIPLAHSVLTAGPASEFYDGEYDLIDLNALITNGREGFTSYYVSGESMDPTIPTGSLVLVDPYCQPHNGDPIVAIVDNKITVKTFQFEERRLYLVPTNPTFQVREVRPNEDLRILGVVTAHLVFHRR